jgi:hypothetical protein
VERLRGVRRVVDLSIARATGNASSAVTAVDYRPDAPAETRMRTDHGERAPAALLVAGPERVDDVPVDGVRDAELGVLVDTVRRRVLVGSPVLLRSTFTRLMFLDDRFSPGFQPVDDRTACPEEGYAPGKSRSSDPSTRRVAGDDIRRDCDARPAWP